MPTKHLRPNRAWTLIRDGGQPTEDEAAHLTECEQCAQWLSVFAGLARNAGFTADFSTGTVVIAEDQHLAPARIWNLIRDGGRLALQEIGHLHTCSLCND